MSSHADQIIALAEEFRDSFASLAVDRNAVNLLVHNALMRALDAKADLADNIGAAELFQKKAA